LLDAEPETLSATQVCDANGIDERFSAMMRYPNDVVAMVDCSMTSASGYGVTVIGTEGTATLACPWYSHKPPDHLDISTATGSTVLTPDRADNAYFLETENFADVVTGTAKPEIAAEETVRTMRTLARLRDAAS